MIGRIFTVGGFTLLSRITGFVRDIVLAAILGAGPIADAFFVALRLPNHFRAIFAEGAFNAAFVPAYARIRQQSGADPSKLFADRIFTLLFVVQAVLLAINSADDERNPPELGILERELKRIRNGRMYLIPGSEDTRGHGTTGMARLWKQQVEELLRTAPKRTM